MEVLVKMVLKKSRDAIKSVVDALKGGNVVILPTDTIYGFSGVAGTAFDAARKIQCLKGRDKDKPFIELIADAADVKSITNDVIPQSLLNLWPAPLTIIVKKACNKSAPLNNDNCAKYHNSLKADTAVNKGASKAAIKCESDSCALPTVALRCPKDEWLRTVIRCLGHPIYSTSVNIAGDPPLVKISDIIDRFSKTIPLIIDDSDNLNSAPSTIVRVTRDGYELVRRGALDISNIAH